MNEYNSSSQRGCIFGFLSPPGSFHTSSALFISGLLINLVVERWGPARVLKIPGLWIHRHRGVRALILLNIVAGALSGRRGRALGGAKAFDVRT